MRLPTWMRGTKLGTFLLILPICIGLMLALVAVEHLLSHKKIDWFVAVELGIGTAVANAWVPATRWRPRLNLFDPQTK